MEPEGQSEELAEHLAFLSGVRFRVVIDYSFDLVAKQVHVIEVMVVPLWFSV